MYRLVELIKTRPSKTIVAAVCFMISMQVLAVSPELLPQIPLKIPDASHDGVIYIPDVNGKPVASTLDDKLQRHLTKFIRNSHSPIAAVVVADVKTGRILAIAQGLHPDKWEATTHSALHVGFPAASLFKTVVTAAAFEVADIDARAPIGLYGGCQNVRASGVWMKEINPGRKFRMSLRRAYGRSCNSFFAKLAINNLGLGAITDFAKRFGWDNNVVTDFNVPASPIRFPSPVNSSTHTVGRFAAGFGHVGVSAVHNAWMMLAIANQGVAMPLRIFQRTPDISGPKPHKIIEPDTAARLMSVMDATIRGGTSSFAFRRGKMRRLRNKVGGKTGTLSGKAPKGVTTWFAGMMPLDKPEVVVSAVVILEDLWFIKGPNLAAEALYSYYNLNRKGHAFTTARFYDKTKIQ